VGPFLRPWWSVVALFSSCPGATQTVLRATNSELSQVASDTRAGAVQRAPRRGDWVLQSQDLRVAVAASVQRGRTHEPGALLQVQDPRQPTLEPLEGAEFFVRLNGREVALEAPRFEALLSRGEPVLRLEGAVRDGGVSLELQREYTLEPGRRALHVRTRLTNTGLVHAGRAVLGARLAWGGAPPFAPGLGIVLEPRDGVAPWVGNATGGVGLAWAAPRGDLQFGFTMDQHGAARSAGVTEVRTPSTLLGPGVAMEARAAVLLVGGDLGDAARAAALVRGERVVDTPLELDGVDERPVVTVLDAAGHVALVTTPGARRSRLPLAPGAYTAYATAPGHSLGDPARFDAHEGDPAVTLSVPPGGRLRVGVWDLDHERRLPARVQVKGIPPTLDPLFGPPHDGHGAGTAVLCPDGQVEVSVPPGRYRVHVTHGPEFTVATQEVEITATQRADVSAPLRRVVPMEGWVGCDLHVHADPSFDSRVSIIDRVASLVAEGVGFATPTEHNVVGDYRAGVDALPAGLGTLRWVPAVEVTTDRNAQPWGHFNVFPYRPDPDAPAGGPPPFLNTPPRVMFQAARANTPDAFIQVNHPRMQPNIGYFNVTGLDPRSNTAVSPEYDPSYTAIEVFNGFYLARVDLVEAVLGDWFALLNTGARYLATGSSDSHQVAYQWAGYPRTYVHVGAHGDDPAAVLQALRAGRAFVTSGPMLLLSAGAHEPGDTAPCAARRDVTFRVRVLAAPWVSVREVELVRDGQRVATVAVRRGTDALRLDTTFTLPVGPGSWVVAIARGPSGGMDAGLPGSGAAPFAFTNPIFFGAAPAR
jgi:hypothetical protein